VCESSLITFLTFCTVHAVTKAKLKWIIFNIPEKKKIYCTVGGCVKRDAMVLWFLKFGQFSWREVALAKEATFVRVKP